MHSAGRLPFNSRMDFEFPVAFWAAVCAALVYAAAGRAAAWARWRFPFARAWRPACAWLRLLALAAVLGLSWNAASGGGVAADLCSGFFAAAFIALAVARLEVEAASRGCSCALPAVMESPQAWVPGPPYSALRSRIESLGFSRALCVASVPGRPLSGAFRASVFLSGDAKTALRAAFFLRPGGIETVLSLRTRVSLAGGGFAVFETGSMHFPLGLSAPPGWNVERLPMECSPEALAARHAERVAASGGEPVCCGPVSAASENSDLREWLAWNESAGLLERPGEIGERGILTPDGKYGLWIEKIYLAYFGRAPE